MMKFTLRATFAVCFVFTSLLSLKGQGSKMVPLSAFTHSLEGPSGAITAGDTVKFTFSLDSDTNQIYGWESLKLKVGAKAKFPANTGSALYEVEGWLSTDPTVIENDVVLSATDRTILLSTNRVDGVASSGNGELFSFVLIADQDASSASELVELDGGGAEFIVNVDLFKKLPKTYIPNSYNLKVFPNPASNNTVLSIESIDAQSGYIVDQKGTVIKQFLIIDGYARLSTNGLQGYYTLIVTGNNSVSKSNKLLIIN